MEERLKSPIAAVFSAILAWVLIAHSAVAGPVNVLDWELQTQAEVQGVAVDGDGNGTPTNPYQATQNASADLSSAQSIFDVSWDAAGFFDFLIEGEHACQGGDDVTCRSTGTIYFTPHLDSTIELFGEHDFAMGGGDRFARLSVALAEVDPLIPIINSVQTRQTLVHPAAGQMTYQSGPRPLTGGVQYAVAYTLQLTSFSGSATDLSMGDGFVHMQISPVPTPSSGAVLLVGAAALLRRKRRGRCAS